jgi:hypothetical protein
MRRARLVEAGPSFVHAAFTRQGSISTPFCHARPYIFLMSPLTRNAMKDAPRERRIAPAPRYRICKSREFDGSLCVTVETSQLLRVRRAIGQSGCKPVGIVKAAPLACGTRVRLVIALRQEHLDRVMRAITQAVEVDETAR